jgi:uncharacterized protein
MIRVRTACKPVQTCRAGLIVTRGVHVVVSGHSHRPHVKQRNGVLFVNPGSPGPRRFKLPIAAGELIVQGADVSARIVEF